MKRKIFTTAVAILLALLFVIPVGAMGFETTQKSFIVSFRNDLETFPYGQGRNQECYYPNPNSDAAATVPEIYTWFTANIFPENGFASVVSSSAGKTVSMTFDTFPEQYRNAMKSLISDKTKLVLRMKANTEKALPMTIEFTSLDGAAKFRMNAEIGTEWTSVIGDIGGTDGWFSRNSEKQYLPVEESLWAKYKFGHTGFNIKLVPADEATVIDVTFDYIAVTFEPESIEYGSYETHKSYINGYSDGTFRPNNTMTRAEACTIVAKLLGFGDQNKGASSSFTDANGGWYTDYIAFLENKGMLKSYSGTFEPNKPITRAEFAELVYNAGFVKAGDKTVSFTDVPETHERYAVITAAASAGLVGGYADGTFLPDRTITRAQVATVVNNALGRTPDTDRVAALGVTAFSDVDKDFWAYGAVSEAAVSHDYSVSADKETWASFTENVGKAQFDIAAKKIAEVDALAAKRAEEIKNAPDSLSVTGTKYYVSPDGNDDADGKSPETAWKTLDKVNGFEFADGDGVFFERGGLWRGSITMKSRMTYGAYGEGEKPKLYGSPVNGADASMWELAEGTTDIWRFKEKFSSDIGNVIFNDGENFSRKLIPNHTGMKYVTRKDPSKTFDYKTEMTEDLDIFFEAEPTRGNMPDPTNAGTLYLKCKSGNPGEVFDSIEFAAYGFGFYMPNGVLKTDITVDNFCIKYFGAHGICPASVVTNFTASNCEIGWIGGSVQHYDRTTGRAVRFGNGVEVTDKCKNYVVENCHIYECYDAGITYQQNKGGTHEVTAEGYSFRNNLIEYCNYSIEIYMASANNDALRVVRDSEVNDNILRFSGFGFGETRPDSGEQCSHIRAGTGADNGNRAENLVISGNIFDRGRYSLLYYGAYEKDWLPTLSGNTYIQYYNFGSSIFGFFGTPPATNLIYSGSVKSDAVKSGVNADLTSSFYFADPSADEIAKTPQRK